MSKRPFILFGLFAALCLLVIPLIAIGKEGEEDAGTVKVAVPGSRLAGSVLRQLRQLPHARRSGHRRGRRPDLDDLLVPSGTNTAELYEGNASRVLLAVQCGLQGRMPRGILEEEEAHEVAQFVAAYAGQIGKGPVVNTETRRRPNRSPAAG